MSNDYLLIKAAKDGSSIEAIEALAQGASITARDFDGRSVLEVAAHHSNNDLVRVLVRNGADPNQVVGRYGDTLLHRAARTGNIGFATALLENRADVNATNNAGQSPLHLAVEQGYEYLARDLVHYGALLNASDNASGNTPLHYAAIRGDVQLLTYLLSVGANASTTNSVGYTALHEAAAHGHTQAATFLLDRTAPTPRERRAILSRVRLAAELHGRVDTAAALHAAEQELEDSFASRVRDHTSQNRNFER